MKLSFFSHKRCVQVSQVKTVAWCQTGSYPFLYSPLASSYGLVLFRCKRNETVWTIYGTVRSCCSQEWAVTICGLSGFAAGVKKWELEQNLNKAGTCEESLWTFPGITWRSTLCSRTSTYLGQTIEDGIILFQNHLLIQQFNQYSLSSFFLQPLLAFTLNMY